MFVYLCMHNFLSWPAGQDYIWEKTGRMKGFCSKDKQEEAALRKEMKDWSWWRWGGTLGHCKGTSKVMDGGLIVMVQKLFQSLVLNLRYTHPLP